METATPGQTPDKLYEYDREPVARDKLLGAFHFASLYAGEHTAATEFVIGALFVSWGASVMDIFVGLLIGNLLAMLSWALFCAPIAVNTRLTLYWYVHRIGGSFLAFFYNIFNAVLYCVLAGTMLTVSASAVRLIFRGIPPQTLWYPTDYRFVLIVLFVGAIMVLLAILGFKRLAQFAAVCSPWMILMFVAGGLVMIPLLGQATGTQPLSSFSQFWEMASKAVWTGEAPAGSNNGIGFWHVVCFAWICNLAMHIGLSDMAAFRFAKKARYGLCTGTGMFLGHYVAWIFAGLMGAGAALALKTPLDKLDSGAIGFEILGVAGAIAVVLSGWTTAMPTLYKSGLALQAVTPNWPRWKVTAIAGGITSVIACFPFVFAEMLNFLGLYGLLLLPIGTVVFTEHWIFPRIGLTRYWVHHKNLRLNWPALATWILTISFAMVMWKTGTLHLFFLFIPVYFLSMGLYIGLAILAGARHEVSEEAHRAIDPTVERHVEAPKAKNADKGNGGRSPLTAVFGAVAIISLIACVALPLWVVAANGQDYAVRMVSFKHWMIWPTLIYFVFGSLWMAKSEEADA